jgi:hypothetical protein
LPALAQNLGVNQADYRLQVRRASSPLQVDGALDEPAWATADSIGNFWQAFPFDTSRAETKTEVKVLFDDGFLYIGAVCHQGPQYIIQSLRRDFQRGTSDLFAVNIDPFQDRLNGFNFAVSPYGVQREGLITNGAEFTTDWDNKWYSEVTRHPDRWVVEMAIPFKTLRYRRREGANEWLVNFMRNNLVTNEASVWAPVPRTFTLQSLAFCGALAWEQPPPHPGANVSLIPYALAGANRDYQAGTPAATQLNAGFDAKVAVTPALNLDLTVNPDFAQVEVDRQVTNLSRFELFFPERRQFFLENSDLFGSFGLSTINPFFSRRIGLARNDSTGFNETVPILAGARLSGRLDQNWRVGALNLQTAAVARLGLPGNNFGMLAVQRRVFARSNVALALVNKQPVGGQAAYNRVAALEYNLASADGRWLGKAFYHRSFGPGQAPGRYAAAYRITYNDPHLNFTHRGEAIGANHQTDVGFLPRRGVVRSAGSLFKVFYPQGKVGKLVNNFSIGPDYDVFYGQAQRRVIDWDAGLFADVQFQNSATISVALLRWDFVYLFADFDPSNTGGVPLAAGTSYRFFSNRFTFTSNARRRLFFTVSTRLGDYFNGRIMANQLSLNYRWQPYGIFALDATYNRIRLPRPHSRSDLLLIGPRAELSFSRSVFFTAIAQYNNQVNNLNFNARLQWRFRPVSDLFVVYTDNYFAYQAETEGRLVQPFQAKNRALVLKLTYWVNL